MFACRFQAPWILGAITARRLSLAHLQHDVIVKNSSRMDHPFQRRHGVAYPPHFSNLLRLSNVCPMHSYLHTRLLEFKNDIPGWRRWILPSEQH